MGRRVRDESGSEVSERGRVCGNDWEDQSGFGVSKQLRGCRSRVNGVLFKNELCKGDKIKFIIENKNKFVHVI